MMAFDKSLYYNPNKMLSYNRIINFVIGARSIGKSYAMNEYPLKRFLKNGEEFIYLRRYKTELKKVYKYFDDIQENYPEYKLTVEGNRFLCDGKVFGYAMPLSTWQSEKSNSYPKVTTIIYDEFIREKDNSGYIPNEVDALLNLMDTVIRTRDNARCICLSNSVSIVNPYFLYFGLVPDITKRFNAYRDMLVEIPDSTDFAIERRKTRFGMLIDGTDYADMSLDNKFVNDSSVFIDKRSKRSKYKFTVIYNGLRMGVWVDVEEGLMYMSQDHDPSSKKVFALTKDDFTENTMIMISWKENFFLSKLVSAFKGCLLRFNGQVGRTSAYEMFHKMNIH